MTLVRPLTKDDHPAWRRMWTAYLEFYETTVTEEVYLTLWERLHSKYSIEFNCLIAEVNGN